MIPSFTTSDVLSHGTLLAFPLVLFAGAVAGCNPCCVPLYPAAAAVYWGTNTADACCGTLVNVKGKGLKNAIGFVLGISAATTTLGIFAASAGTVVGRLGSSFRYAIAAIPILMSLHLLGWLRPIRSLPHSPVRNSWRGAFGGGFLLALALTPCGTPVLASVLSYVAYKGSVVRGAILLFSYGIGTAIPLLVVGTTAGRLTAKLEKSGYGSWAERISGVALLILGLFLMWRA